MDTRGGRAAFSVAKFENGWAFDRPEAQANHYRHKHATEGSEGQDEVTDEPQLPRFLVRRDVRRGWMVWDRQAKGPAKYEGKMAIELPEDQARKIKNELTLQYLAKG
jgi:hypothetical protein